LTVCLRAGYLIWESNTLATKDKKSATKKAETSKVTRIKANDSVAPAKKETKKAEKTAKVQPVAEQE
jgi:hypothetical protein